MRKEENYMYKIIFAGLIIVLSGLLVRSLYYEESVLAFMDFMFIVVCVVCYLCV